MLSDESSPKTDRAIRMNENPDQDGKIAAPVFVEDLFLTDVFLIFLTFPLKR